MRKNDFDHERSIVFSISEYHLFENLRQKDDEKNNTKKHHQQNSITHIVKAPQPHPLVIVEIRRAAQTENAKTK